MPRKKRPLDRTTGIERDASIVVVACEDKYAVKQYFAKFRTRRTQFKVLPTDDCKSNPRAVIDRLHDYKREYAQEEGDEFWFCIDTDHWIRGHHQRELSQVLQECRQSGYGIAISNPCFEVWLLLHFIEINNELLLRMLGKDSNGSVDPQNLESLRCDSFVHELRSIAGQYNKSRVSALKVTAAQVQSATQRAKVRDLENGDIPPTPGSRIYKLIESLRHRDFIDLSTSNSGLTRNSL